MMIGRQDQVAGIPYFIGKVLSLERQVADDGTMCIIWYWPRMPHGMQDGPG